MAFDWRTIITIEDSIGDSQRATLEKALDQLVATGPEGQELIQKAAAMRNGRIAIGAFEPRDKSYGAFYGGKAYYEREHTGRIQLLLDKVVMVEDAQGNTRPLSVTGALVHELYHLADPHIFGSKGLKNIEDAEWHALTEEERDHIKIMQSSGAQSSEILAYYQDVISRPERLQAVASAQLMDQLGSPFHEVNAVRYTDQFMKKYFTNEPRRGYYYNGKLGDGTPPLPTLRTAAACYQPAIAGFTPTEYRGITAPAIEAQRERNSYSITLLGEKIDLGCWKAIIGGDTLPREETSALTPQPLREKPEAAPAPHHK